jgi:ACR3 family arsenite efflux pump ArsB
MGAYFTAQVDGRCATRLILLATALCTAMALVWSNRCHIEPHLTLSSSPQP